MSDHDPFNAIYPSEPPISVSKTQTEIHQSANYEDRNAANILNDEHDFVGSRAGYNGAQISPVVQLPSLPPTPPSPQEPQSILAQRDSIGSHASGFVTPTSVRSPPTPDLTPPRLRDMLNKPSAASFHGSSSYAASFKSAQEDLIPLLSHASDDAVVSNIDSNGSLSANLGYSTRTATSEDVFAGINEPVSFQRHSLKHKPDFHFLNGVSVQRPVYKLYGDGSQTSVSDFDADSIPRFKQPPRVDLRSTVTPPKAHKSGFRNQSISPETNETIKFEQSPAIGVSKTSTPNEYDTKRLSGTSGSSTIVEAVVIDRTPPSQERKLRHVSKTDSLRSNVSPEPNGIRDFQKSPLGQQHVLRHRRGTIPPRPVTAPHVDTEPDTSSELSTNKRRVVSDPLQVMSIDFTDVTPPPPSASPASLITDAYYDAMPILQMSDEFLEANEANRQSIPGSYPSNSTEDSNRRSLTRSIPYSANSTRQLYGASPLSAKSEITENFEINEASAVKLSAHTNSSLVVVNNSTSSDLLRSATTEDPQQLVMLSPEVKSVAGNSLMLSGRLNNEGFDPNSPLQNPRTAPAPPSIAVTRSTPAKAAQNSSDESKAEISDSSENSHRQSSLFTWARKYSGSLVQPISGTLRRSRRIRASRHSSVTEDDLSLKAPSNHLHPRWQPREQPMSLSQTGQEFSVLQNTPAHDVGLDSESHNPFSSRANERKASVKGFLIGNTLGLERGPTNKRRPVISYPELRNPKRQRQGQATDDLSHVTVRQSVKRSGSGRTAKKSRARIVLHTWRERIRERRLKIRERSREKRRASLRNSIEGPFQSTTGSV